MKKLAPGDYDVSSNEHITMTITPRNGAGESTVAAKSNGNNSRFFPGTTPRLEFDCKSDVGAFNSAIVECDFPGDPPGTPFYEIKIEGNPGGDTDTWIVRKSDATHEPSFMFKVVKTSG